MAGLVLRGMTWAHPRGYDPLVACARLWREQTGVEIVWEKRSLQDFETYPVDELAARYDLIVIDHPHVGQITREGCLIRSTRRRAPPRPKRSPRRASGPPTQLPLARRAMGAADRRGGASSGLPAGLDRRGAEALGGRARSRQAWRGPLPAASAPFADVPLYPERQSRPPVRRRRARTDRRRGRREALARLGELAAHCPSTPTRWTRSSCWRRWRRRVRRSLARR